MCNPFSERESDLPSSPAAPCTHSHPGPGAFHSFFCQVRKGEEKEEWAHSPQPPLSYPYGKGVGSDASAPLAFSS